MPSLPASLRYLLMRFSVCFILLVLLIAGGGLSPASARAQDLKKPTPARLKKILADFEKYAEAARQAWQVPGMAIAVIVDDKIVFAKGFGVKQVGGKDKVDKHTIFQIGSTSKAFTAALVAMLVDDKKVGWKDKVVYHLPAFQMEDPWVTREFMVEDLMAQHSGLPPYAGDAQSYLGFDRAHIIHSLRYLKPVTSFRSRYAYQNGLFLVAAALVEKYTDKSWEDNLKARLFKPLGMSATSAGLEAFQQAKNVSFLHKKNGGKVGALPTDWPDHNWVYIYGPAGGINSNVLDMCKWLRLQLDKGKFDGKQIISEPNLEFLHTPKTIMGSRHGKMSYYCEAWLYQALRPYPLIWHNGGTSGNKTMLALVPEAKIGIVVLSNLITELPEALAFQFYDLYFQNPPRDWSKELLAKEKKAKADEKVPPRPSHPAPPLPLDRYAGAFHNEVYGTITITPEQDKLFMIMGPKQKKVRLQPWDRDTFSFSWLDDLDSAVFTIGPDGRAQSLFLDWDGGTEFKRVAAKPAS